MHRKRKSKTLSRRIPKPSPWRRRWRRRRRMRCRLRMQPLCFRLPCFACAACMAFATRPAPCRDVSALSERSRFSLWELLRRLRRGVRRLFCFISLFWELLRRPKDGYTSSTDSVGPPSPRGEGLKLCPLKRAGFVHSKNYINTRSKGGRNAALCLFVNQKFFVNQYFFNFCAPSSFYPCAGRESSAVPYTPFSLSHVRGPTTPSTVSP